ncbi:MAG: TIGR03986 family CRISPR-associated RAMP protein [Gammaproteobacteria bacterium]|nr:MAG: TIGR03986 family CRISPR-associated RAMP protein [Gammaproteobacteria bacterium]
MTMQTGNVHAPYNFIPLSRFIFLPNWAHQVSHDIPFSDGVSGSLQVELTCHTPTLVGGQQTPATDQQPGRVEFFKGPDGKPVIAGSTLKGAISNVLEIASFARFNRLADKRYSVRDLSAADNFYFNQFHGKSKGGKSGWLRYNAQEGCWQITPCKMARIHQRDIIKAFDDITEKSWTAENNSKAHQRYTLLKGIRDICFAKGRHKTKDTIANWEPSGSCKGKLVVTGQPGQAFNKGKSSKKWEFVFYAPDSAPKTIAQSVMHDFKFIHSESDDWKYWQKNNAASQNPGIPVFYMEEGHKITSIGLAFLYRLAYKNTTHDAVKHTQISHIDGNSPDLPALMFGHIDNESGHSLRGRVNIGAARLQGETVDEIELPATILGSPKPTYYPAYIRQPKADEYGQLSSARDYKTLMNQDVELSGWKRYQTFKEAKVSQLDEDQRGNTKVQVKLVPVNTGSRFVFNIHFHNLREVELGALLWALDFGGKEGAYHTIGMGKPFGLGRVSLKVIDTHLQTNRPEQYQGAELLQKATFSFTHLMQQAYATASTEQQTHSWQKSPQLQELYYMAMPCNNPSTPYMKLAEHADSKKNGNLATLASASGYPSSSLDLPTHKSLASDLSINPVSDEQYRNILKEQQEKQQRAEQERLQKEQEKQAAAARAEERAKQPESVQKVMDLEDKVKKYQQEPANSTLRKDLNKLMGGMAKADFIAALDAALIDRCQQAIAPLDATVLPDTKQLNKLCKALEKAMSQHA